MFLKIKVSDRVELVKYKNKNFSDEQIICSSILKNLNIYNILTPNAIEWIVLEYKNSFLIKCSKITCFHETFIVQILKYLFHEKAVYKSVTHFFRKIPRKQIFFYTRCTNARTEIFLKTKRTC